MTVEKKADRIGKIIVIVLMAVFVTVGILTMVGKESGGGMPQGMSGMGRGGSQGDMTTVTVSVKAMEPETLQKTVLLNGDVASRTETSIYPDTSGKVSRILKSLGDTVRRGEVIAYVDPSRPGSAYAASPVTATVAGTIIQQPYSVGDTIGTSNALAVIGSLQDLEIRVKVSEKYSSYLKVGLPAYVSLVSAPEEHFTARIASISPVVNPASRTQEVTLVLDQQDSRIKPGMFAQVRLVIIEEKDTFVVPLEAIRSYNDDSAVFVVAADNTAYRKLVTTGVSNDNDIQIVSGLIQGDQVIVAGSVTEGMKVRVAGTAMATTGASGQSSGQPATQPPAGR
ncbi:MAG: efflux RND transporter periplasmic adaptor subunit [Spirochaetaceae bacterium]|nr:efflux RND transporter periplasmic adaptor subunit [Spirochaetaceae bacterium]